ncbi:MAG: bifunctional hydroxymethylpyrimidine kinase/phosphomethylpyrimidine kinase [Coraliomargaritaceae bacterium]
MSKVVYVLTISGSDSSGCSGMQADNRVIHAAGAMPLNVITACTLQTPKGLHALNLSDAAEVERQVNALLDTYPVRAIKIGMLGNASMVTAVARSLKARAERPFVVLDPVVSSSSGSALLDTDGLKALNEELLPLVGLVTPNLEEMPLLRLPESVAVLRKGGHAEGTKCVDRLILPDGREMEFSEERVNTPNTRGTGCALSAGIAAYLANGCRLPQACERAKSLLQESLRSKVDFEFTGTGPSFF